MPIHFDPLTAADVPLLTRWLQEPHVRAFWDDGERDEATVRTHYFDDDRDVPGFIFRVDDRPTGFLQAEHVTNGHEFQPWAAPVGETWAIDLLIGEPERTGQGLGPQVIQAFIEKLRSERPEVRRIVIDPDERNARAIRAYAKAGFGPVGMLDDDDGRRVIMRRDVP